MKNKLIFISGMVLFFGACGVGGEKVPITTSSEEALADFRAGLEHFDNLRVGESREYFEHAIEKDPKFALAHIFIVSDGPANAITQRHLRAAEQLAQHVSKAEQIMIKIAQAEFNNEGETAYQLLQKLAGMYPNDERTQYRLGLYQNGDGDVKAAIKTMKRAISINRDFAPPYNQLAYCYKARGDFDKAEQALLKYSKLLPQEANPYDSMGDLLVDKGELEKAIKYFIKAYKINPVGFGLSMRKAALNQIWLGRFDEARANYRVVYESEETALLKVETLQGIALSYWYEGNPDGALPIIAEALAYANSARSEIVLAQVHFFIAMTNLFRNNLVQAKASHETAKGIIAASDLVSNIRFYDGAKRQFFFLDIFIYARGAELEAAWSSIAAFKAEHSNDEDDEWMTLYAEAVGLVEYTKGNYNAALESFKTVEEPKTLNLFYQAKINLLQGNTDLGLELMQKVATPNANKEAYYPFIHSEAIAALAEAQ